MATITISIDDHDQPYTVREMRRRLAQVLSKLDGDQIVSFSFNARLENYKSPDVPTLYQPFVNTDGTRTGRITTKSAGFLGAPYNLKEGVVSSTPHEDIVKQLEGLWGYAKKYRGPQC